MMQCWLLLIQRVCMIEMAKQAWSRCCSVVALRATCATFAFCLSDQCVSSRKEFPEL